MSHFKNKIKIVEATSKIYEMVETISNRDLEVKKSENELNLFFKLTPNLVCIANNEGYFIRVSDNWTDVLGWSREELLSKPYIEFVHPDDRNKTVVQTSVDSFQFINRYICADGTYRIIEWNSNLINDYHYAVAKDITDITEKTHLLIESESRFRRIFNISYAPMVIFDNTTYKFVEVNQSFANLLGYETNELVDHKFTEFLVEDDVESSLMTIEMAREGKYSHNFINRYRRKDGTIVELIWNATLPDDKGIVYGIVRNV